MNNKYDEQNIDNIIAELSVPTYKDLSVIKNKSHELDIVNKYFDSITLGDKDIQQLLYSVIGYALVKTADLNKAFIFKGNGRNSKSKIFRIIERLLDVSDKKDEAFSEPLIQCSHEHLEQLSGNKPGSKTSVKLLAGCTVNIAEDQKQPKYINISHITRLISGEPISIEKKRNEYEIIKSYATLLFSVNDVIDFKETGIHITDRFVVIPFNATFTDENGNRNINIEEELCKPLSLQIIATKAILAIKEVLKNGKFPVPKGVEEETKRYFMECNNVIEFCEEIPLKYFITKAGYYEQYRKWCKDNNRDAVSNNEFGKKVLSLDYREERYSFNGERKTYYVKNDFDNSREVYNEYLRKGCVTEERIENHNGKDLKKSINCIPFSDYLCELLYDEPENIEVST